jgi:hypothetical protein
MVQPHAFPFKLAPMDKSEVMFKTATDAELAQLVKLLIKLEPTAILKDQHADATKLSTQITNAKIAH